MLSKKENWWIKILRFFTAALLLFLGVFSFLLLCKLSHPLLDISLRASFVISYISSFIGSIIVIKLNYKLLPVLKIIGALIILHFGLTEIARAVVHIVAHYLTNSVVGGSNSRINWDAALSQTVYVIYGVLFVSKTVEIALVLKMKCFSKSVNRIISGLFVISFPTITSWQISYTCGGFLGGCQRSLDVVTPLILSINPINILVSMICAVLILTVYSTFAKVDIF